MHLLRETIADHGVDPEVRDVWLEHSLALRSQITHDPGSKCSDPPPKLAIALPDPPANPTIKLGRRDPR